MNVEERIKSIWATRDKAAHPYDTGVRIEYDGESFYIGIICDNVLDCGHEDWHLYLVGEGATLEEAFEDFDKKQEPKRLTREMLSQAQAQDIG